jgi:hypothetical protein
VKSEREIFKFVRFLTLDKINSSVFRFVGQPKARHKELSDTIDEGIIDKYLSEKSLQCFSMVKPSESAKTLKSVSADLLNLVEHFKDQPEVKASIGIKYSEHPC